jgi:hypothetical protein
VVYHFVNRTSQREKTAFRTYDIHKYEPKKEDEVRETLPETYGENRGLIPDDTFVLIGFYKSEDHYKWIRKNKLYNFRTGSGEDSLILDKKSIGAKYLLLHSYGDITSGEIWKIVSKGPKVYSREDMLKKEYPDVHHDYYLVIKIEKVNKPDFADCQWEFKKLTDYRTDRVSAYPFTTSLAELMKTKIKQP